MAENHVFTNPEVPADEQTLEIYRFLTQKLSDQHGVVIGLHGTSATYARQIEAEGFQNYRCVEGDYGVWFVDDSVSGQSLMHGQRKARDLGESGYAVIIAQLNHPQPDKKGRKQWLANANNTKVIKVEYYEIKD